MYRDENWDMIWWLTLRRVHFKNNNPSCNEIAGKAKIHALRGKCTGIYFIVFHFYGYSEMFMSNFTFKHALL